eukprot:CAMPEP_0198222430 /NCGR_PEP_ID=MMETSP1445-20131203/88034_1 /TAXON_ID=36898 /ORGANISM="Pyramimonas sp., Strain CCMP2087" /LENGTH=68 /DNA_ID=CAMNT_0043900937 /DNA_START=437 /DNA_END=640 /DNA_ORIENTATION=-
MTRHGVARAADDGIFRFGEPGVGLRLREAVLWTTRVAWLPMRVQAVGVVASADVLTRCMCRLCDLSRR